MFDSFENDIIARISPTLDTEDTAVWFERTLFITCSYETLSKIKESLTGFETIVNKVGDEYAIDFVG